ncbi:unnamed protein product [Symbiodinium natans]|uniref:Uncharacterized protein n=1 Tax=Symbiodinium natans TaxID=878477 RepID=A0A812MB31_9DINO|nr:unnamed protein product [Symbiodinium natans]
MGGWATVWNRVRHKSYSSYVGVRGVKSIPFQCKQGPQADGNCAGKGGSCTPYPFWPNTPFSQQEPSWQDSSPYTTYAFVPHAGKEEPSYQAYRAAQSTDVWIVHGHDLAGAQATDCGGDVHYFEHFEEPGNPGQCSKTDPYPAQDNQCSFVHPGVQQTFGKYQCGWWRGYQSDKWWDAGLYIAWDNIGVDAEGATSVKPMAMDWLRNCDNCEGNDASLHTWRKVKSPQGQAPVAFFTGVLFPWICASVPNEGQATYPWTRVSGWKCYCDNEPWGGRGGNNNVPNHNMQLIYCAKWQNERKIHCDMIVFTGCGGAPRSTCSGAHIQYQDFELDEASFP